MKTIKKIDELLVGVEVDTPLWHMLIDIRMEAVLDVCAIRDAMKEINEMSSEYDTKQCGPASDSCASCKFTKSRWPNCKYLIVIHEHTGLELMPHD